MSNPPDLTMAAVKMVLSLMMVLAIIWALYRVAKKRLPLAQGHSNGKMLKVIENQYLGLKKTITMVQVPGSILVLGVSPDRVNLLTQIDDPEVIKGITASTNGQRSVLGFKEQLQRLTRARSGGPAAGHNATSGE
jgi:flagellar protein FliO/FliZ